MCLHSREKRAIQEILLEDLSRNDKRDTFLRNSREICIGIYYLIFFISQETNRFFSRKEKCIFYNFLEKFSLKNSRD